jgi:hypothetical protein
LTGPQGIQGIQGIQGVKGDPGGWVSGTDLTTVNLNTVTTPGLYRQPIAANATLLLNYPTAGIACSLEVLDINGSSNVLQRLMTFNGGANGSTRITYTRRNNSGTWDPWRALSTTRVDQTAGRVIYQWDDVNSREQIIYGDTGHRRVETSFINGWTCAIASIRRVGSEVTFGVYSINPAAQTNAVAYNIPAGFRQAYGGTIGLATQTNGSVGWLQVNTAGDLYPPTSALSSTGFIHVMSWHTLDAWPTTLPGTASGTIPNS